jgi:outer membrane protein assembly factor BamD (BamD/ComL family)
MLKHLSHLALAAVLGVVLTSCKSKKTETLKAGELSEAQKIELRRKAVENYKKLIEKYPESPHAEKAKERIQALGGAATPKK